MRFYFYHLLFFFFFGKVIKLLFKNVEHHVHDGEHFDQEKIQQVQKINLIECKNLEMEIQFVKPQTRTHLNKVLKRRVFKRSKVLSFSSKVHVLCSVQTSHIKHAGTIFHMVDRCFPNQFLQGKRSELTVFGDTQWIPNTLRIALHNARENLQWSRR